MRNYTKEELEHWITYSLYSIELDKERIKQLKEAAKGMDLKPMWRMRQEAYQNAQQVKDKVLTFVEKMSEVQDILKG